jgi:LPS sulfotransferase NodH
MLIPQARAEASRGNPNYDYGEIRKKMDTDYSLCRESWEKFWTESTIDVLRQAIQALTENSTHLLPHSTETSGLLTELALC